MNEAGRRDLSWSVPVVVSAPVPDPQSILIDLPDELVGPRVVVRCLRDSDAQAFFDAVVDSRDHIAAWLPWPKGYESVNDALAFVRNAQAHWHTREDFGMGIFERSSGRFLGGLGMHPRDWTIRRFEIGYWIRQAAMGQGYVTEAVQVVTRFAFDRLEANRVEIRMDVRNTRSRAVPERLGFVYEGCLRKALPDVNGQPRDVAVFALTREDYRQVAW